MQNGKDTIYIDVDDEITTIIDKVVGSKQKVVALVLPKRASVLQSVVNMKLLKRSADNVNKNVVLVTSEAALMPLAGTVGVHVAKTPLSKPEIPVAPVINNGEEAIDEDEVVQLDDTPDAEYTADNAGSRPVGELAGGAAALGATPSAIETVELDDAEPAGGKKPAAKQPKGAKQPKIPNFSKFQKRLFLGGVILVLLIVGLYVCAVVLPKATIAISTDATDYNSSLDVTLDSGATTVLLAGNKVPATVVQQQKTYTQQVAATGQQNNGNKATGSVKITNCSGSDVTIPAGTGFNTDGSHVYLSQSSVTVPQSNFHKVGSIFVCQNDGNATVNITAQNAGADYNTGSTSMTFSKNPDPSNVKATGSASGGTDNIVKVVSQADIDNATKQINAQDTTAIKSALTQQLRTSNLYPLQVTFLAGTPNTTTSSNAGDPADNVTVTESITYTMYGAKRDYLDQLIKNDIKQQIDTDTQTILNDGLDNATFKAESSTDTTNTIGLSTTATVGPKLNLTSIKNQVKGNKSGYVRSTIGNLPGVTDVKVDLSPFWVSSVPKNTNKITITVGKSSSGDGGS